MKRLFQSAFAIAALVGSVYAQEPVNPLAKPAEPTPVAEPAPAAPVVTLVEAGAEPRQTLRITPAVGQEQAVRMKMQMTMAMKVDETEPPAQTLPPIVMTFRTKVVSVEAEGDIRYEFAFTESTVEGGDEQIAEVIRGAIAPFTKITGLCRISSRGVTKEAKLQTPEDLDPGAASLLDGMKQQMGQMGAPFPEEAVGPGAKWKVVTKVKSQGMSIDQTATVELLEVAGGVVKMSMSLDQSAGAQKINAPGAGEVDVKSFKSTGTGRIEQKLSALAPMTSSMKLTTDMSMGMKQGGQDHAMSQHIGLEMTFAPAEVKPAEKPMDKPADKPEEKPEPSK